MQRRQLIRGLIAVALVPITVATTETAMSSQQVTAAAADMTPWTFPTMPPLCTADRANAGDVAGCMLRGNNSPPPERGFGTPPFPTTTVGAPADWIDLAIGASGPMVTAVQTALRAAGMDLAVDGDYGPLTAAAVSAYQSTKALPMTGIVNAETATLLGVNNTVGGDFPPLGFNWSGWGYNGSPALASWETTMVRNTTPWGRVVAGRVQGNVEIMDLYAGFVTEISNAGYAIGDIGSYVFRCTSTTRKDCRDLGVDALSNHAWGLAMDINTAANPQVTYRAPDSGGSACSVAMKTDIPKWIVDVAQRWGLYWGGYGWTSGCKSPSDTKSTTMRDPMHFEFNGSVDQARAIVAHNLGTTKLCIPTVGDDGVTRNTCSDSGTPLGGWRIPVDVDAPDGAMAVLVNITLTGAPGPGFVTAESCGAVDQSARQWSNGNFMGGQTVANLSVVPIDGSGRFCIYLSGPVHSIVDVQGFFAPARMPGTAGFVAVEQRRVLDTRYTGGALIANRATSLPNLDTVPAGATAVLLNATVVAPTGPGYLTADTCARLTAAAPTSSNVNFGANVTAANLAVVPLEGGTTPASACVWPSVGTQLVADLQGAFVPNVGLGLDLVEPTRLVDTRLCADHSGTQRCNTRVGDGRMLRVTGASGKAALINLTLTDTVGEMYAVADRCDVLAAERPLRSNANGGPGRTVANLAVVPVGEDGSFCIWVSRATHVIIDIQGVLDDAGALRFIAQTPKRRLDTRTH